MSHIPPQSNTETNSETTNTDAGYKEKLINRIKEKVGEHFDPEKFKGTLERWMSIHTRDEGERSECELGKKLFPIEYYIPDGNKFGANQWGLWSMDELQVLTERRRKRNDTENPFDRTKWKLRKAKGSGQSPVDIGMANVKKCWLLPLRIHGLFQRSDCMMINDGETLRIHLYKSAFLYDGPIFGRYRFDHIHFHWSQSKHTGTEHAFNGKKHAVEAHIVFQADSCDGYRSAVRKAQLGHAIVAILFRESSKAPWYTTFSYCSQLENPGKAIVVPDNCLRDFASAFASPHYYSYAGSTELPPFVKDAEWIVLKIVMPIGKKQVDCLRALNGFEGRIKCNVRPLQDIGQRKVISTLDTPAQIYDVSGNQGEFCENLVCE